MPTFNLKRIIIFFYENFNKTKSGYFNREKKIGE